MSGYTKLFHSILASTVWREPAHVRLVWITLLAMTDRHGVAEASIPGLADFARVSVEECRDALQRLSDPDRDSRSKEHEGRRIEEVDGGWRLLNHAKYRRKLSEDERREYLRVKQAEYRQRQKPDVSDTSTTVSDNALLSDTVSDTYTQLTQAEADTDPKAKEEEQERAAALRVTERSSRVTGGVILSPADYERLQRHNAYVGARLRVPHKLHGDFVALLGGESPDAVLRAFYASVDAELEQTLEPIAPDVWKWLTARFQRFLAERLDAIESAKFLAGGA